MEREGKMQGLKAAGDELLRAFRCENEVVRWALQSELRGTPMAKVRNIPFGTVAGSRRVIGRGKLVRLAGRYLLTSDISVGLSLERFHWSFNGSGYEGYPEPDDGTTLLAALAAWELDTRGSLRWRIAPHSTIKAGSLAKGLILAGRNEQAYSLKGTMHVEGDLRFALANGHWPWGEAPEWD